MPSGKVLRFDRDHGYGFIQPDPRPGDPFPVDIFMHASVLSASLKETIAAGQRVVFDITKGDKGLKATNVRIASDESAASTEDDSCDVLTPDELAFELGHVIPTGISSTHLARIREGVLGIARRHGWLEDA